MRVLILAAGLGTRLLPHTQKLPKPLFPLAGQPLLGRLIRQLEAAGAEAVLVNTHHLHEQIERFLADQEYGIPVYTRYEPRILGTGGAIANGADFFGSSPFLVVNSDITTDLDFQGFYRFHLAHPHPVTLALFPDPAFNTVSLDSSGFVRGFGKNGGERLTFTGVQALDPLILDYLPKAQFYSTIDAYRRILAHGYRIAGYRFGGTWMDLGTAERFQAAAIRTLAAQAFACEEGPVSGREIALTPLKGDGSDRGWYRVRAGKRFWIAAAHGIRTEPTHGEADAFVAIGNHLSQHRIPVPQIHRYDRFSGIVLLQDLGDSHLQDLLQTVGDEAAIRRWYQEAVDILICFSQKGLHGFDPAWTHQSQRYDRELILEKECRYFVEAFLQGYAGLPVDYADFAAGFEALADGALRYGLTGLMHRDFQSRNLMVHGDRLWVIDFQGARTGPLQYDLASLLIDPYAELSAELQERLLQAAIQRIRQRYPVEPEAFQTGYRYCAVTRNLQILGAFGFLTRVKQKPFFQAYIPPALASLQRNIDRLSDPALAELSAFVKSHFADYGQSRSR